MKLAYAFRGCLSAAYDLAPVSQTSHDVGRLGADVKLAGNAYGKEFRLAHHHLDPHGLAYQCAEVLMLLPVWLGKELIPADRQRIIQPIARDWRAAFAIQDLDADGSVLGGAQIEAQFARLGDYRFGAQ